MINPERFPAGTGADPHRFNEWTRQIVERQEQLELLVTTRLDELERVQSLFARHLAAKPTSADNLLRDRASWVSGTAQQDVWYGQVIQPLSLWTPRRAARYLVSQPHAVGGPVTWQEVAPRNPFGFMGAADPSSPNEVKVRCLLPTTRRCNALIWEPLPAWASALTGVKLLAAGTETALSLDSIGDASAHGPQRFFFPDQDLWGAEVSYTIVPSDGLTPCAGQRLELAWCAAAGDATFAFTLQETELASASASGEGSWTLTLNSPAPGQVTVHLTTPPQGPTSVVRGFSFA